MLPASHSRRATTGRGARCFVALWSALAAPATTVAVAHAGPDPAPPAATPDAGADAPLLRVEEGRVAAQHGDVARAEQIFSEAMAMAPADTRVALAVGSCYYGMGRVDDAIRIWSQALNVARSPDLLFNLGIAYRSKSLFAQAILSFEEVVNSNPASPPFDALFQLADTYVKANDNVKGVEAYKRLTAAFPNSAPAWNDYGNLLVGTGQSAAAINAYRAGLRAAPNDADLAFNLGRAQEHAGDAVGAIASYEAAVRTDPTLSEAWNNLGVLYDRLGQKDKSLAAFQHASQARATFVNGHFNYGVAQLRLGHTAEAIAALETTTRLDPTIPDAFSMLGEAYLRAGRTSDAMTAYKRAQQLAPKDPASRLGLGIIAMQNQHYDEAIGLFNDAISLNPNDGLGYLMASRAQLAKGDVAGAVASCREAVLRSPNNADVAMGLGAALEKQGNLNEALAQYERGMQLAPTDQLNRLTFARLAEKMGAYDRARAAYQGAIAQGGEVDARKHLAELQERSGDLDQAATVLDDALKVFPGDADLKVRLAEIQYRQRKYDPAEANLRAALRVTGPHQARAHYLVAFLDYRKGNSAAAQRELDSAVALAPDMAEAYYQKGEIYAAAGKNDLARQSYTKAIQIRSTYTDAILAIKRLESKTSP
jgi:tetratricopeptide (TPR) repeat protein